MKKLLSVVLAALMLFSVLPLALPQNVTAVTTVAKNTAYLAPESGDDETAAVTLPGGSDHKPYQTIAEAYNALGAIGGGTLVIEETFTFSAGISDFAAHNGTIVITGADDDVAIEYTGTASTHWLKFGGPVVFENIKFVTPKTFYLLANHNPLTIGEGVTCEYPTNDATQWIVIAGGSFNISGVQCNSDITVKSGSWRCVVGGSVATGNGAVVDGDPKTSKNQNGTFKLTVEGGTIANLMGGHWGTSSDYVYTGGQAYVYVKGGNISKLYFGSNNRTQATLHDGVVVYTGGTVGQVLSCRTTGVCTLFYGENVSRNETNYPEAAFTIAKNAGAIENVLVANVGGVEKNVTCHAINELHVIPLATNGNNTVYLKHLDSNNNEEGATALGTEENPVRYMHQAIAMLTYTGGTIKLMNDYTFAVRELNGMCQFVEPDHAPIVIDGQGYFMDGAAGVKTHTEFANETNGMKSDVPYGYNTYLMNGATTFKNIDITPTHEVNFAANFNAIVLDTDVVTTRVAWISGGVFINTTYNSGSYVNNHYDSYQYFSDKDTSITINSGTNIRLSGYSRLAKQAGSPDPDYTGTANITVNGGHISAVYTSPTNSLNASGASANVVINGGTVDALFIGGHDTKYGSNSGDVNVTINGGIVTDYKTGNFVTCAGELTYEINTTYADYLATKATLEAAGASVNTVIEAPAIEAVSFGTKDFGDGTYGVRAKFSTSADYWEGANADDYNIVELGVLVATEANAEAIAYVQGEYYYGVTEFVANPENHDGLIGKSVMYVKEADAESESYDSYAWAGGDADVFFTAPIIGIDEANLELAFVFVPYMVMVDAAGNQQVFYGNATVAESYNSISAQ